MTTNPERIILNSERKLNKRGQLKIFFGYASGVGKTYSMLEQAHQEKENGRDVVVGYIEPHGRSEVRALLNGLERIDYKKIPYNNLILKEFDLDKALERHPDLIIVDELAHTNPRGARHNKRYQDIEELLSAGIDVYTTENVQHIESLNDKIASITEIVVRERIPDSIFDNADQVELVDIEPEELIKRLKEGKIFKENQAKIAINNFFSLENLTALREIALRRCADRVNTLSGNARIRSNSEYYTDEHILVCLSSSPSNANIIRTGARMARAFKGNFTALYVESPDITLDKDDETRLKANMRLAEQLGAKVETVYGDDVPFQISEYARLSGVSKIVLGRSGAIRKHILSLPNLTDKLISYAPNLDIHIIPDKISDSGYYRAKKLIIDNGFKFSIEDIVKCVLILTLASAVGLAFRALDFDIANIIMVYTLAVLLISILTKYQFYSWVSALVAVLVFNFIFTEPFLTFHAYGKGYPVTFVVMFLVSFISGSLAGRLKNHAKQAAQATFRTKVLFETNQLLQQDKTSHEIMATTANQIVKLLNKTVVFYLVENDELILPRVYTHDNNDYDDEIISSEEMSVANWVYKNNRHAGNGTGTLSNSKCLYLAARVNDSVYAVVGIVIDGVPLDGFERSILLSILGESALALENYKNAKEKEEAAILAKNEQLRANLLRAISHDLRTPLTSISGNASNLLSNGDQFDEETKKHLYSDIYDDSMWLINLVENLLAVTKIEEGRLNIKLVDDIVDDVIIEALKHVNRNKGQEIRFIRNDDILLAKMDARLIVQVIINIVDNAIKYTSSDSTIIVEAKKVNNEVLVSISDNGKGISDDMKKEVFDMFYTGANKIADSRRSLGLGLALCKSIINAHGGKIWVEDNVPTGAIFNFTLPLEEVNLNV